MKKLIAVVLSLVSLNVLPLQSEEMSTSIAKPENVLEKVVELHITFAPPPNAEVKKARKTLLMKAGRAICSGSFVSPFGHVLTAKHCVEGATEIEVMTLDNQLYQATVRAQSKSSDLAVIQIGRFNTPHFKLADTTEQSEFVTIIGSPLGLTHTKTTGTVSKLYGDYTILDCTGVPGNSGGPVLDINGNLIGVVSAMFIVLMGPAHLTVAQSLDSIKFFFYNLMGLK